MEPTDLLKITAKSAPVPTVIAVIVYFVYPKIIDAAASDLVLSIVAISVFLIVLGLIVTPEVRSKSKSSPAVIEGNSISNASTEEGDVFIGDKMASSAEDSNYTGNKIEGVETKKGDVFIGSKN